MRIMCGVIRTAPLEIHQAQGAKKGSNTVSFDENFSRVVTSFEGSCCSIVKPERIEDVGLIGV